MHIKVIYLRQPSPPSPPRLATPEFQKDLIFADRVDRVTGPNGYDLRYHLSGMSTAMRECRVQLDYYCT